MSFLKLNERVSLSEIYFSIFGCLINFFSREFFGLYSLQIHCYLNFDKLLVQTDIYGACRTL